MQNSRHYLRRLLNLIWIFILLTSLNSCYHYRVLTTKPDPSTEYQQKIMWSYCWGLINNPKDLTVQNCGESGALDEVLVTQSAGSLILTFVTLGIVAPVKIEWKCHKPCPRSGHI